MKNSYSKMTNICIEHLLISANHFEEIALQPVNLKDRFVLTFNIIIFKFFYTTKSHN